MRSSEVWNLLCLSGLPLLDGFFLAFLKIGLWRQTSSAVAFGVTAFSGAGAVIAAMRLPGTLAQRAVKVLAVYAVVAAGALGISLVRPLFQSLLPDNLQLFTAVFLIGLGLLISGVPSCRRLAQWFGCENVVKAMILASLLNGAIHGVRWQTSFEPAALRGVGIALIAGLTLSLFGAALGSLLRDDADKRPLDLGAGISLVTMGLKVLGLPVPTMCVIAPLVIGFVLTLVLSLSGSRPGMGARNA